MLHEGNKERKESTSPKPENDSQSQRLKLLRKVRDQNSGHQTLDKGTKNDLEQFRLGFGSGKRRRKPIKDSQKPAQEKSQQPFLHGYALPGLCEFGSVYPSITRSLPF